MKKEIRLIAILILATTVATAQYNNKINFNALIDRTGHLVAEIEGIEGIIYIKQSLEVAPFVEGGYFATGTALGLTKDLGIFQNHRIYAAPKLQFIVRGGNVYPSVGVEAGIDKTFWSGLILGVRVTNDYRTDFDFWGGEAKWQPSGCVKVGWLIR